MNEPNSLHFFTSKLNKSFDNNKKIILLEILWEIVLSDKKIHDFESHFISTVHSDEDLERTASAFSKAFKD